MAGVVPGRLGPETVARLPWNVRRPRYDRAVLSEGILHIGVGAFHRCHQAEYTEDALEAEFGPWGIVGVNLRPPDLETAIGGQGGLFCRELRENGGRERRLIGSIVRTISVPAQDRASVARALAAAAAPAIRVITLTVTEKGFCHVPATGELDVDHPDIAHDTAHPEAPVSVPGFLMRVLALRFAAGTAAPTIVSCDNVPDNGSTLRRCVVSLAERTDPRLADRIAVEVDFLNTMVDRIVPATRDEDIDRFAAETGLVDRGLVVGEPFRMWVIERPRPLALPRWEAGGALFVEDVGPYEILKMRVLNGVQSNVCQLGLLAGLEFMSDVMADDVFCEFARRTIAEEVMPNLPPVPGIDVPAYLAQTLRRLKNPDLKHRTSQISTDGSQKIRQRLLEPIRAGLEAGTRTDGLLLGLAGWMRVAGGLDARAAALEVGDPLSEVTRRIGKETRGDAGALVDGLLGLRAVFGTDLASNPRIRNRLTEYVSALHEQPTRAAIKQRLEPEKAGAI